MSNSKKAGGCGCGGKCGNTKCKKCADAAKQAATPATPAPTTTPDSGGAKKSKLDCGCGGKK
jgi:hypothetical protein